MLSFSLLAVDDEAYTSSSDDDEREPTEEEATAAVKLQSVWRGRKVREENKRKAVDGLSIACPNSLSGGVNKRKEARQKVKGGIEGGSMKVIIRYIHFLRGVYLHVRVISGENLMPMDSNGLSDPYVKVSLVDDDKVAYKSMVHRVPYEAQTLNPKWDHGFYIGGSELNLCKSHLLFEVFDYDQWSADDLMGSCEFPLKIFDRDEQDLIRRASKLRKQGGTMGKAYSAVVTRYNALSPAFLHGFGSKHHGAPSEAQTMDANGGAGGGGGGDGAEGEESEEEDFEDEDEDDDYDYGIIPVKGDTPKGGNGGGKGEGSEGGKDGRKGLKTIDDVLAHGRKRLGLHVETLKSVAGFGHVFNKQRKLQGKTLNRKGIFGLDKPLIQQNGERVGNMCWYTRQRVYGDLNIVYNDQASAFMQECAALMKQAGSFMSMATLGKTVKMTGVGDFLSSKVEAAVDTGKRRAVNIVENVLGDTKQKLLNDITKDRDMPGGVRKVFQMVLGVYFSDVQQEVLDELAKRLKTLSYSEKKQKQKTDIQTTLLSIGINNSVYDYVSWKFLKKTLADARAWILYNELPYDKSFWGKLRSPGWWLILCSKLYSGWGIQAFLYALRLSMLDRTDEW